MPAEPLIMLAGSRIAQGEMSLGLVVLAVLPASSIGCSLLYLLASTGGRALIERWGPRLHFDPQRLGRVESQVARIGPVAVLLGRLTPGLRVPTGIAASIFRIRFRYYLPFALLATVVRLAFFLYLGSTARRLSGVLAVSHDARLLTGLAIAVVLLLSWFGYQRYSRPRPQLAPQTSQ